MTKRILNINEYPEWIQSKDVKNFLNCSIQKIINLRDSGTIEYKTVRFNHTNDPKAKNYMRYLYSKKSLKNYLVSNGYRLNFEFFEVNQKKLFYSKKEIEEKLDMTTVQVNYRIKKGVIPAVRFGNVIRIPIHEFNTYVLLLDTFEFKQLKFNFS